MDKAEKALGNKLMARFKGELESIDFSRDEQLILERWRVHNIINMDSFVDMTSGNAKQKEYFYTLGYPFTKDGKAEFNKNLYFQFRDSNGVKIVRDVFTGFAFFASLYAVFYK